MAATAGTYEWVASFSGDSNNAAVATSCGAEPVSIAQATPTVSTVATPTTGTVGVGITAKDTATLSGGASPSGTVTFSLYATSNCTGTPVITGTRTIGGKSASFSGSWTPAAFGTYYWQATYNGDTNNGAVTTACGGINEQVSIAQATPTISSVPSPTAGKVGVAIKTLKDTATLSGASIAPTGSVAFTLYSNSLCTTPVIGVNGTGAISGSTAAYSIKWTPTAAGKYYWIASYPGDANNNRVAGTCGSEEVVITAQPTISTTANPKSPAVGTTLQDSATLGNTSNLLGTGVITFRLYGVGDTKCTKSPVDTETAAAVRTNGPFHTTIGYKANSVGTYEWTATFSGDANNASVDGKCGSESVVVGPPVSETTPSGTTCPQFASQHATPFTTIDYTLSGSKIASIVPPTTSFVYWVKVTSIGTYKVTQSESETSRPFVLLSGSSVYNNYNQATGSCTTVSGATITQNASSRAVAVKFNSGAGPFYIGLNFSSTSVIGEVAPTTPSTTVQYFFGAGVAGSTSEVDLKEA